MNLEVKTRETRRRVQNALCPQRHDLVCRNHCRNHIAGSSRATGERNSKRWRFISFNICWEIFEENFFFRSTMIIFLFADFSNTCCLFERSFLLFLFRASFLVKLNERERSRIWGGISSKFWVFLLTMSRPFIIKISPFSEIPQFMISVTKLLRCVIEWFNGQRNIYRMLWRKWNFPRHKINPMRVSWWPFRCMSLGVWFNKFHSEGVSHHLMRLEWISLMDLLLMCPIIEGLFVFEQWWNLNKSPAFSVPKTL